MSYVMYGCKGSGVASLSLILKDKKEDVIGIDTDKYVYTEDELIKNNIPIYSFNTYKFKKDDILIYGHSFNDALEVINAKKICKKNYEYHEYLNEIIKESKLSIAICGSHGKTYTTGLISKILDKLTNVSYLIGDGEGQYKGNDIFVFEACEYQDHFLMYHPDICIVLNIDYDHVDYFKSFEEYIESFKNFINQSKVVILNKNDQNIIKLNINNAIYYDINEINELKLLDNGYSFKYQNEIINTNVYGVKHIENILALLTLFSYLNINILDYKEYIYKFDGVKRRFKEIIVNGDIYIDDYAHHPTQILYTLEMVKNKYPDYELIVFFKPDRPSRFLTFYKQIATSLERADYVVVMDLASNMEKVDVNILIKENKTKFYLYNKNTLALIKKIKKKVVVSLSSKNMQEVYENIFINNHI